MGDAQVTNAREEEPLGILLSFKHLQEGVCGEERLEEPRPRQPQKQSWEYQRNEKELLVN